MGTTARDSFPNGKLGSMEHQVLHIQAVASAALETGFRMWNPLG